MYPYRLIRKSNSQRPPRVTAVQWILAVIAVAMALTSYETKSYSILATITEFLVLISFVLLALLVRELFKTRSIGKFCLGAGVFVFYWIDALSLASQRLPFAVPDGFPYGATQFEQGLIQQALMYVSLFQLMLLIGYSIRPPVEKPLRALANRVDSISLDRTLMALLVVLCSFTPLLVYYDFDAGNLARVIFANRNGTGFETTDPGLAQHLALFGIYGAALFFVYALKAATWRRLWWLGLAVMTALPFVLGGTRHIWLYISLPSVLIVLRGFKGTFDRKRVIAFTTIALIVLVVAQAQFVYRSVGWSIGEEPADQLYRANTNGQLSALLFAEYLVPGQHGYFQQFVEPYFVIHWIPRQVWPAKPIMESWAYYDDSYVQGAAYNVTPSVIGQFHLNWGLPGVLFIGIWLGFLASIGDRLLLMIDSDRQRAMFVVVGMFYAFIISSFRFYSPIYFSYFLFGLIAMFVLTRRLRPRHAVAFSPHQLPA